MKLIRTFTDNDIYFMEVVSNKVVINDNYDGLLILDNELSTLTGIKLPSDTVIDTSFIKDNEIVLYCYENRCFIDLNVETYAHKTIPLTADIFDLSYLSMYEWIGDELLLAADNGAVFVHIDISKSEITQIPKEILAQPSFSLQDDWENMSGLLVHKIYPNRQIAAVEANSALGILNYRNGTVTPLEVECIEFHDIEVSKDLVIQVSETEISVFHNGRKAELHPSSEEFRFLRCKPIMSDGEEYLLVLASSNANSSLNKFERYSLKADLAFNG